MSALVESSGVTVLDRVRSLEELAETVRHEHSLVEQAMADAIAHAISAGEALLEAKQQVPAGTWLKWAHEQGISNAQLSRYMRIAYYKDVIRGVTSVKAATKALVGLPQLPVGNEITPDVIAHVRHLHEDGASKAAIAEECRISLPSVRFILDPDYHQQVRERKAEWRAKRTPRSDGELVNRAGGTLAGVRKVVVRCLQALEKEAQNERYPTVRAEIEATMHQLYEVEDQILKAARVRLEIDAECRLNS